jgi:hypothetical protein
VCGLNAYSTTQLETTLPDSKLWLVKDGIEGVRKGKGSQCSKLNGFGPHSDKRLLGTWPRLSLTLH